MDKSPIIGKDVIESLTLGMYEDSRFIYREYIQNSADQIDKAVKEGLIDKQDEEIHIIIDPKEQRVEFYDNATGIEQSKVSSILRNIAQSTKVRGVDKGFRGIGRLGGLGYCSKLIFETSAIGETVKSIMVWDAKLLKDIINNRSTKENAAEVIEKVTTVSIEPEKESDHYFRVILEDVSNKELLNIDSVRNYLAMVSPVGYKASFIYKSEVYKFIDANDLFIDTYKIYLNSEPINKLYTTDIKKQNKNSIDKIDEILKLEFFSEKATDGSILYWGWYGISSLKGQIPSYNEARGIRLRKANIQLGSDETLSKFFPGEENRWSYYYFGEIHAVHPDLIPNARRDYFSENDTCKEFEFTVKRHLKKLYDLAYAASKLNSSNRKIQEAINLEVDFTKKQNTSGFQSNEERLQMMEQLEKKRQEATKAKEDIAKIKEKAEGSGLPIERIYEKNTTNKDVEFADIQGTTNNKTKFVTDKPEYSRYNKKERKFLGEIYAIIGNILPKDMSEMVIKKIEEELTK